MQQNNRRSQTYLRPRQANKKSRLPQTMCVPRIINSLKIHKIRLSLRRKERISSSRVRLIRGTKKFSNKIKKEKAVANDNSNSRRIQRQQEPLKTIVQKETVEGEEV